jgi:hypothetical protein
VAILQDAFEDIRRRPLIERKEIIRAMDPALDLVLGEGSTIKIRPPLENAIHLLRTCLSVINDPKNSPSAVDDSLLLKIAKIFLSILYGDRPTKKVIILLCADST